MVNFRCLVRRHICSTPPVMNLSKTGRLFLAALLAVNGLPALGSYNATPIDRNTVLQNWANALGMSADLAQDGEIASIEYWASGTINLNGHECALTNYHASVKYQVPGMRVELTCVDGGGQSHHQVQIVAGASAWNEDEAGAAVSATGAADARIVELWTGPLALVKAAKAAGTNARVAIESNKTTVTFPVPGLADASVKATLSAKNQAERVDARLGTKTIQTIYSD